jgi:peptidoglycan hydrolase-like protein with peptidoglycan-binding domain
MRKFIVAIPAVLSLFVAAHSPAAGQPTPAPPQSVRDLDMDAVPTLSDEIVRRVQQALVKKGIDPGPIDGIFGPRTKEAVRKFQDRYGIKTSGEIDNQTLFALGESELALRR